ncbi:TonB family protein [Acidobacteria bacterium AB60]|nr:TonB family protein [Acidobacteria bacterium AB60]
MRTPLALMLLASSLIPAAASAAPSEASAASGTPVRITTGVVPPAVLNSTRFTVTSEALAGVGLEQPSAVLHLKVNDKGLAEDVRIVRPINPKADEQVLAAVRGFRFRPATLDGVPVPVELTLTVLVQR